MNPGKTFLKSCLIPLGLPVALFAQIPLDDLVEIVAERPEAAGGVEAPETRGHGQAGTRLDTDRLHFLNGDRLSGDLLRIDTETGLVWRHPDAAEPVSFGLDNLKRVEFRRDAGGAPLAQLTRVTLTNGDQYRGTILRMDASTLLLDTPYAGDVTVRAAMIESIRPDSESLAVYEGPNSLEEWVVHDKGNGGWTYKNQALYADKHNQIVGLDFETFPDLASVEFDLAWRGNPQLNLHFWSETVKKPGQETYTLMIQNSYVRLYRNSNKRGRDDLGNTNVNQLRNLGDARVKLLLNREAKEILMFLNGEMVKSWKDPVKGDVDDDAFLLQSSGNSPMKISNIRIGAWNGKLENGTEESNERQDLLRLNNGDKFSGTLAEIEAGVFRFQTDFASFDIPVDRVDEIRFGNATRETPRLRERDALFYFTTGEHVTLDLASLENGSLSGSSEAVGTISVRADFLREMTLNPYDERREDEEDGAW